VIRLASACALLLAVAALVGCEKKRVDATRVRVTGKVTLDGKLLDTGTAVFEGETGEPPGSFNIVDGKYEGMAAVGKNKVRLSAFRKVSMKEKMKMDGPGYDQMVDENLLPTKYNDGTLVREVTAEGPNNFDFDLKSK
jgi:hypothetical protein